LKEAWAKHAAAASAASDVKQSLADRELMLVAAAAANGDVGENAVGVFFSAACLTSVLISVSMQGSFG